MSHIYVINNPSVSDIASAYGARWGDPEFDERYSNLTPSDIRECAYRCIKGEWRPLHVYGGERLLAAHHFYHVDPHNRSTWCSGMVMVPGRGSARRQFRLRQGLWEAIVEQAARLLLDSIFCYVLATNTAGQGWVTECCGFTPVGLMRRAVPEGAQSDLVDIVAYSYREEDMEECRDQAERLFPEGRWDR